MFMRIPFDRQPFRYYRGRVCWAHPKPHEPLRFHRRNPVGRGRSFRLGGRRSPFFAGGLRLRRNTRAATRSISLRTNGASAILSGDAKAMDSLLADDYMAITPAGTLQSRDETLRSFAPAVCISLRSPSPTAKCASTEPPPLSPRWPRLRPPTPMGRDWRLSLHARLCAQSARAWKIVSFEASHVRQPGQHKRND